MTTTRTALALFGTAVLALSAMSCDAVTDCEIADLYRPLYLHSSGGRMWVGGEHRVVASGFGGSRFGDDCHDYIMSDQHPDSFNFTSDNPAVAPIDDKGVVTALAPGTASIVVGYQGNTRSVTVIVHERVATVAAIFAPAAPKVGETVTVGFEAQSADGQPIRAAKFSSYVLLFRTGQPPSEYVALEPDTAQAARRFVATSAGTYQTYTTVERLGGPQTTFISKVVVVP